MLEEDPYAKSRKLLVDLLEKWLMELVEKRGNDPVAVRIAGEMEEVVKTERATSPLVSTQKGKSEQ